MKKITSILIAFVLVVITTSAVLTPHDDGFYKTYDDFVNGKLTCQGWITSVRGKVNYYDDSDPSGKEKKYSLKDNTYWGCRQQGESFRFHDGEPYRILSSGKITLYSQGPIKPVRDKDGIITKVEMEIGEGGKELFYHSGTQGTPKKMTSQNQIGKLLEDDKEVYDKFSKGKSIGSVAIFMNVITCVQLYNSRNK